MPRPVKKRNRESFTRDLEHLTRLRTALLIDPELPEKEVSDTIEQIDRVIEALVSLRKRF